MTDTYELELKERIVQAWFGGSFDPVHNGHLLVAQDVVEQLCLDQLNFIPCYLSPLKHQTACSQQDRVNMLRLAIEKQNHFALDLRELEREGSSFTIDTLKQLRVEFGDDHSLQWVIGWDAFISLPQWHLWRKLGELCNFVVLNRPGFSQEISAELQAWCSGREVVKEELQEFNFGKIVFLNTPLIEISSSLVRERRQRGLPIRNMLPEKVEQYILENRLFIKNIE